MGPVESPYAAIATLDDESRLGMFEFIRRAGRTVTRDEAAGAVGISRKLAAFHLDKLVDAGLLVAGPAEQVRRAGRPPKAYGIAPGTDLQVSIPARRHNLLAELLVQAVATVRSARDEAVRVARAYGERLGAERRRRIRAGRVGADRALTLVAGVLEENDFEPVRLDPARVRLRSCPFHPVAECDRALVCGMNHALVAGVVDGMRMPAVEAVLDPDGGECCIEVRPADPPTTRSSAG